MAFFLELTFALTPQKSADTSLAKQSSLVWREEKLFSWFSVILTHSTTIHQLSSWSQESILDRLHDGVTVKENSKIYLIWLSLWFLLNLLLWNWTEQIGWIFLRGQASSIHSCGDICTYVLRGKSIVGFS